MTNDPFNLGVLKTRIQEQFTKFQTALSEHTQGKSGTRHTADQIDLSTPISGVSGTTLQEAISSVSTSTTSSITGQLFTALRSQITTGTAGQKLFLKGYSTPGDGGEGTFTILEGGSYIDNGGTIACAGGLGASEAKCAIRDATGPLDARWFGVDATGVSNIKVALVLAEAAAGSTGTVYFPAGSYLLNSAHSQTCAWQIDRGTTLTVGSGITLTMAKGVDAPPIQWLAFADGTSAISWTDTNEIWANWFPGSDIGAQLTNTRNSIDLAPSAGPGPWRVNVHGNHTMSTTALWTKSYRSDGITLAFDGKIVCTGLQESASGLRDGHAIDLTGSVFVTIENLIIDCSDGLADTAIFCSRDENRVSGTTPASAGGHTFRDCIISGLWKYPPYISVGSEANGMDNCWIQQENTASTSRFATALLARNEFGDGSANSIKFNSKDPSVIVGNGERSGTTTAVADLVFGSASTNTVHWTSALGGLPTVTAGTTIVEIFDCADLSNNGVYTVSTVVTPNFEWIVTRSYGAYPANEVLATSVNIHVRTLTHTTSVEATFSNCKLWANGVVAGVDADTPLGCAGVLLLRGFGKVRWSDGEMVTGNDTNASHIVLDSTYRAAEISFTNLYTHQGSVSVPDYSIRAFGRPDAGSVNEAGTYLCRVNGTATFLGSTNSIKFTRVYTDNSRLSGLFTGAITSDQYTQHVGFDWMFSVISGPTVDVPAGLHGLLQTYALGTFRTNANPYGLHLITNAVERWFDKHATAVGDAKRYLDQQEGIESYPGTKWGGDLTDADGYVAGGYTYLQRNMGTARTRTAEVAGQKNGALISVVRTAAGNVNLTVDTDATTGTFPDPGGPWILPTEGPGIGGRYRLVLRFNSSIKDAGDWELVSLDRLA